MATGGGESSTNRDRSLRGTEVESETVVLASRPGYGTVGTPIMVKSNYFELHVPNQITVVKYRVDVKHERVALVTPEERQLCFWRCVELNPDIFGEKEKLIFDGRDLFVIAGHLKFPKKAHRLAATSHILRIQFRLPRLHSAETVQISLSLVGLRLIDVSSLLRERESEMADSRRNFLRMLRCLFQQRRLYPFAQTSHPWHEVPKRVVTLFNLEFSDRSLDVNYGQLAIPGMTSKVRFGGDGYQLFLVCDVSYSRFYKSISVVDFLAELTPKLFAEPILFSLAKLNNRTMLPPEYLETLNNEMKGKRIITQVIPASGGAPYNCTHVVNCIKATNPMTESFLLQRDGSCRMITVYEYFRERYPALRYPRLNLLSVGSLKRETMLPMERCMIADRQRVSGKAPTQEQSKAIIKAAACSPLCRQDKISHLIGDCLFDKDQWLRQCGVSLNVEMKSVGARVLPAPKIIYGAGGDETHVVTIGSGDTSQELMKCYVPAECKRMGAIFVPNRIRNVSDGFWRFLRYLLKMCSDLGMHVPSELRQEDVRAVFASEADDGKLESELSQLKKAGVDLVIVGLPYENTRLYEKVKRLAEVTCGIMTQCVSRRTIVEAERQSIKGRSFLRNIAWKLNTKLGGINRKPEIETLPNNILFDKPTLVWGVDSTFVSHGSAVVTVAAVAGNVDNSFLRYGAGIYNWDLPLYFASAFQENIMLNFRSSRVKPQRVIIFRDGVSEEQYNNVLRDEIAAVRDAFSQLGGSDYKPPITYIACHRRHNTFFSTKSSDETGNVPRGTVVDVGITRPDLFEFYLCSHSTSQGTSRPVRYCVLVNDEKFSADQIQTMTHQLTFYVGTSHGSVRIPAPIYYANLACQRGRAYLQDGVEFKQFHDKLVWTVATSPEVIQKMYFA